MTRRHYAKILNCYVKNIHCMEMSENTSENGSHSEYNDADHDGFATHYIVRSDSEWPDTKRQSRDKYRESEDEINQKLLFHITKLCEENYREINKERELIEEIDKKEKELLPRDAEIDKIYRSTMQNMEKWQGELEYFQIIYPHCIKDGGEGQFTTLPRHEGLELLYEKLTTKFKDYIEKARKFSIENDYLLEIKSEAIKGLISCSKSEMIHRENIQNNVFDIPCLLNSGEPPENPQPDNIKPLKEENPQSDIKLENSRMEDNPQNVPTEVEEGTLHFSLSGSINKSDVDLLRQTYTIVRDHKDKTSNLAKAIHQATTKKRSKVKKPPKAQRTNSPCSNNSNKDRALQLPKIFPGGDSENNTNNNPRSKSRTLGHGNDARTFERISLPSITPKSLSVPSKNKQEKETANAPQSSQSTCRQKSLHHVDIVYDELSKENREPVKLPPILDQKRKRKSSSKH